MQTVANAYTERKQVHGIVITVRSGSLQAKLCLTISLSLSVRRTSSPGSGEANSGVVRAKGPQRDWVPSRRGEEEQPRAEANGAYIFGSVAGISHLRARATIARVAGERTTIGRRAIQERTSQWQKDLKPRLDAAAGYYYYYYMRRRRYRESDARARAVFKNICCRAVWLLKFIESTSLCEMTACVILLDECSLFLSCGR